MPKKYRVEIAPSAEMDINKIWDFISADNLVNAKNFISKLEDHVKTLENFPRRCAVIPESPYFNRDYRHLLHGSYRIVFRIHENVVYVLRIIHETQLLDLNIL